MELFQKITIILIVIEFLAGFVLSVPDAQDVPGQPWFNRVMVSSMTAAPVLSGIHVGTELKSFDLGFITFIGGSGAAIVGCAILPTVMLFKRHFTTK